MNPIDTSDIDFDRAQVFLLYATFAGDIVRTAHAAGVRPVDVLRVADEEGWTAKLAPILELSKSQRPGAPTVFGLFDRKSSVIDFYHGHSITHRSHLSNEAAATT